MLWSWVVNDNQQDRDKLKLGEKQKLKILQTKLLIKEHDSSFHPFSSFI